MPTVPAAGRHDLANCEWSVLEPLLPAGKKAGRPPKWARRQLIDGIRWRIRAGAPWRDVPPCYGPWQSVYGLFRCWQRDGTWRHLWRIVGEYANISIFDVESSDKLHELLTSLPLFPFMQIKVTPLCRHPSAIGPDGD